MEKRTNRLDVIRLKLIFIILFIELYFVCMFSQLMSNEISVVDFITQSLIFLLISIVILTKKDLGVFSILFFTLVYGTAIIYDLLILNPGKENRISYLWIIMIPLVGITTFVLSKRLDFIIGLAYQKDIEQSFVTVDKVTGYELESALIKDLKREMIKSKRHGYSLSIMLVELEYANDLKKLYSESDVNSVYLEIANSINKLARLEDMKYRYKEDQFILVLPFTDINGVEVIRNRFSQNLKNVKISTIGKGEDILTFRYKIAIKEYDGESEDPILYLKEIEKELEYYA